MQAFQQLSGWPLVGRERELEAFDRFARNSDARVFTLHGPAGIGKSRLAEECIRRGESAGLSGKRATASIAAAAVPLGALAHLLPAGLDMSHPVASYKKVAEAMANSREHLQILLVDNLHLLDATSVMLIQQLLDADAIRLIGTVRSGEPVNRITEDLYSGTYVERCDLAALNLGQVETLLSKALGRPIGKAATYEFYEQSKGNPLYLRELLLGAHESGGIFLGAETYELRQKLLPGTRFLNDLIVRRFHSIKPSGRQLVEVLAVCEEISLLDAEAICKSAIIDELEKKELIEFIETGRRINIRLRQPLHGDIIRQHVNPKTRRAMLLQQARAIESYGMRRREDALRVASWRLAATGTCDPSLLKQAAQLARHAHDYAQVAELISAIPPHERTVAAKLMLGEALSSSGEWEKSETTLAEAYKIAQSDYEKVALNFARTFNLFWFASLSSNAFAVNKSTEEEVREEGARRLVKINEGTLLVAAGELNLAIKPLAELESTANSAHDINIWLWSTAMKATALALTGKSSNAIDLAYQGYDAHLSLESEAMQTHPASQLNSLCAALMEAGRLAEAVEVGEKAFRDLLAARAPMPRIWTAFLTARAEWIRGHPRNARLLYAESVETTKSAGHTRGLHLGLSGMATSAALVGDIAAAEKLLSEAREHQPMGMFRGEERLAEAWIYVSKGKLSLAREVLMKGIDAAYSSGNKASEMLLLTEVGRLGGAGRVVNRMSVLAREMDGSLSTARYNFVNSIAQGDSLKLLSSSSELEELGADLLAAEAAALASRAFRANGLLREATAAEQRSSVLSARCQGAKTPNLLGSNILPASLTPRELEIVLCAVKGDSSKEIAAALCLSVRTVDNHLQRVYGKLGVRTRRELRNYVSGG
ncbi:LuxR C-terminal-related transcriptional regulator [Streptomyces sp. NPDC055109]